MKEICTTCNGSKKVKEIGDYNFDKPYNKQDLIDVECGICDGAGKVEVVYGDIPEYGDHMTMKEFTDSCKCRAFIDYDGYGNYANIDKCTNLYIKPSDIINKKQLNGYTHIVWYNR